MEQITLLVPNRDKAHLLIELLHSLDFISDIEMVTRDTNGKVLEETTASDDFFALAGLWSERDISIESLRAKAWPGR